MERYSKSFQFKCDQPRSWIDSADRPNNDRPDQLYDSNYVRVISSRYQRSCAKTFMSPTISIKFSQIHAEMIVNLLDDQLRYFVDERSHKICFFNQALGPKN